MPLLSGLWIGTQRAVIPFGYAYSLLLRLSLLRRGFLLAGALTDFLAYVDAELSEDFGLEGRERFFGDGFVFEILELSILLFELLLESPFFLLPAYQLLFEFRVGAFNIKVRVR